jgi:hypothetical protein
MMKFVRFQNLLNMVTNETPPRQLLINRFQFSVFSAFESTNPNAFAFIYCSILLLHLVFTS